MKEFIKMVFASCLGVIVAGGVLMIIFFSVIGSIVSSSLGSFTKETSKVSLSQNTVLEVRPVGPIQDKKESFYFSGLEAFGDDDSNSYTLGELKEAIAKAADDGNIDAISLDLSKAVMGFATAQELREALLEFKKSGKPIYVYSNMMGKANYYVSSVADKIYLNPEGTLLLNGFASQTLFFTGPLAKLGVEMQIFKVGEFKGAVEPFVRKQLSEPNRRQIQIYLDGLWQQITDGICASRQISHEALNTFANKGLGFMGTQEALNYGLADSLMYELDYKPLLAKLTGHDANADDYSGISVKDFLRKSASDKGVKKGDDAIGFVVAEGEIKEVPSNSPYSFNIPNVIDMDVAKKLRKLADDESVKAVVMRVNSPGGSAFLSEQIWKEAKALKEKKPLVVSMGNYAASGGYYISSPATKIFADSATLTGSIGIFGMFPNFAGTAKKIDLTQEVVKTNDLADLGNTIRPMTAEEKALIQQTVENGYDLFKRRVAEGRGMTVEQVDSVGQGRVWLGAKAVELGLVDEIGNLDAAFDEAARLADIDSYFIYQVKDDAKNFLQEFLGKMQVAISTKLFGGTLSPEEQQLLNTLRNVQARRGILAMPYEDITVLK